jgi:hypothetical protein
LSAYGARKENSVSEVKEREDAQEASDAGLRLFCHGQDEDIAIVWSIADFLSDLCDAREEVAASLGGKNWLIMPPKEIC